jgi:hypothetical protein
MAVLLPFDQPGSLRLSAGSATKQAVLSACAGLLWPHEAVAKRIEAVSQ